MATGLYSLKGAVQSFCMLNLFFNPFEIMNEGENRFVISRFVFELLTLKMPQGGQIPISQCLSEIALISILISKIPIFSMLF